MILVADLTHYFGIDEDAAPASLRNLAAKLCAVARAGTAGAAGPEWVTALRCRCRPARRLCGGHLVLSRGDQPAEIAWHCDSCADGGLLHGWEDTPYDLRPTRHLIGAVADDLIDIPVSDAVIDTLHDLPQVDIDVERVIWSAASTATGPVLCCDPDQLEDLVGWAAAAANHEPDRRRQRRLDTAFEALNAVLVDLPD